MLRSHARTGALLGMTAGSDDTMVQSFRILERVLCLVVSFHFTGFLWHGTGRAAEPRADRGPLR